MIPNCNGGSVVTVWGFITKLPESGVLCGNITEFGVVEDSWDPPPPQTK